MTKDRLDEFKLAQKGKKDTAVVEISSAAEPDGNKLRKTFERSEVVRQWTEQIESNLEQVSIFLNQLEDLSFNQKDVQNRLDSLFQNNLTISKQISSKLKEIELEIQENRASSAEKRIISIQHQTASTRFKRAFVENNKQLENFKNLQKQQIRAQLSIKGNYSVTDEELTSLLDEGKDLQVFTENIIQETAEAKRILRDVEERHQQLLKIERMLMEVHDLFLQMAILVDNQQELVDRIEYQAQAATTYVVRGNKEIDSARKSKKKHRKCCLILSGIGAITILIIIVMLIQNFRN